MHINPDRSLTLSRHSFGGGFLIRASLWLVFVGSSCPLLFDGVPLKMVLVRPLAALFFAVLGICCIVLPHRFPVFVASAFLGVSCYCGPRWVFISACIEKSVEIWYVL